MTIDEFENLLKKVVDNPNRLVNEVLQLENYVFRDPSSYRERLKKTYSTPINDLDEILCYKKD